MRALNHCAMIGRLGRNPEVKELDSGTCVVNFTIACDYQYKDRNGDYQVETNWIPITAFGKLAETMAEYLKKGMQVYVEGRFKTDSWKNNEGEIRYFSKVYACNFIMLRGVGDRGATSSPNNGPQFTGDDFDDDIPF